MNPNEKFRTKMSSRHGAQQKSSSNSHELQVSDTTDTADALKCPIKTDIYMENFESVEQSLPLFFHATNPEHTVEEIGKDNMAEFLQRDLDVSRLNAIHSHMWACGRPLNARALHRQKMMKRKLLITEQADLHLLYHDEVLYIKPLPTYLLSRAVWDEHLVKSSRLHMDACGLFLSYIWLVRSPVDFTLAKDENLLPKELSWKHWRELVHEFLEEINATSLHQVNPRYHFGELRLHRINSAYRMVPRLAIKHFVRGYLYGYNRYGPFFQRSVGWILVVFIWFSLILSAMQVGASIPELEHKDAFNKVSYGFVVFSIVQVAALVAFITVLFTGVFFYNMVAAICHAKKQEARRRVLARRKHTDGAV